MTFSGHCDCCNDHNEIPLEKIFIENGALEELIADLHNKRFTHPILIADQNTFRAAENFLSQLLAGANIHFSISLIQLDENNDVVADEKTLVQALLDINRETDVIIAVGSGTLHDIARFCSAKTGIPFISVPTAPSVDGFTSMGAPLIVRGIKTTFQMTAPIAVFADLAVLNAAPPKMIAAGFGDMLAKYTSLVDWTFSHLVKGEPYCPLVYSMTREALDSCVENIE
jgi:glycerol-1-phosphate dehydrogenase [NAD(P)+]